jgi:hypothetical protein
VEGWEGEFDHLHRTKYLTRSSNIRPLPWPRKGPLQLRQNEYCNWEFMNCVLLLGFPKHQSLQAPGTWTFTCMNKKELHVDYASARQILSEFSKLDTWWWKPLRTVISPQGLKAAIPQASINIQQLHRAWGPMPLR